MNNWLLMNIYLYRLGWNGITDEGVKALVPVLKKNEQLVTIELVAVHKLKNIIK